MTQEETLRERVAAMEVEIKHMSAKLDDMAGKVSELHDILKSAQGAKWLLVVMMTGVGFIAGKLGAMLAWLGLAK